MITIKITPEFISAYTSVVRNGAQYVNLICRNGASALYCECKDVFYMSIVPSTYSEDISLRLTVETCDIMFRSGEIAIEIVDKYLNLTHTSMQGNVTATATVLFDYCILEEHIMDMLHNTTKNAITITDPLVFKRALALTKSSSVKGVQFNNGFAYAMANGYLAYMKDPIGLNFSLPNFALKSLVSFIGNADSCNLSNYMGYNLCNVGFTVFGWRRARPTECFDLSSIEYDYSTSISMDLIKLFFATLKRDITSATLDFSNGILSVMSNTGKYSIQTDIETTDFGDGNNVFKLNTNILRELISSFDDRVDLRIVSGSTIALINNGVFYFMGGAQ